MNGQSAKGSLLSGLPRELGVDELVIGSDDRKALVVISEAEGTHAVITYAREGFEDGQWWIENRSVAGTFLNGERLAAKTPLSNGDCIAIAGVEVNFSHGWLREGHGQARGVKVDVRGVSDTRGGRPILRSVSFTANEGEFIGILGPSGCGKSSVIQRIAGLAGFKQGSIAVNGHSISGEEADTLRQLIAYLPQNVEDSLHNGLSIREEMACARRIFLAPGEDDEAQDDGILKTLGLSNEADIPIGKLSGGQKRRVAIALALLRQPQLLLLDEPTAGLDPATETEVMRYLRRLSDQGHTVICATHVMENVSLFDKVLVMASGEKSNGGCAYFGAPDGVLAHFGVGTYPEMYARLKDGACVIHDEVEASIPQADAWKIPEPPPQASFRRSVGGYLLRFAAECFTSIIHPRTFLDRLLPGPLRSVLLQPILIAIGLKWGCAKMFSEPASTSGGGVSTVLFCAALSVFWLGLAGNVQGLVRERVPGRCLERLGGVSLCRYLSAKVVTLTGSCFVKTLVFALLLFLLPEIGSGTDSPSLLIKCLKDNEVCSHSFGVYAGLYGVLALVCMMGGLVGLAVSAVARKATTALSAVPVIAVLALFFSQPVIQFDTSDASDGGSGRRIAEWMPCYRPQLYTSVMIGQGVCNSDEKPQVPIQFLVLFLAYAFGAVGLSVLGQSLNERAWNGR